MEPFKLDRQAKVFLAVLIVLAIALVPLAPFASLAFGALSLVVLCVVFLIALARNRRLFGPLTQTEGALAVAAGTFALSGALVVVYAILMLGAGSAMMLSHAMLPFRSGDGPRSVGDRSVWYSDADKQQQVKDVLSALSWGAYLPLAIATAAAITDLKGIIVALLAITVLITIPSGMPEFARAILPIGAGIILGTAIRAGIKESQ